MSDDRQGAMDYTVAYREDDDEDDEDDEEETQANDSAVYSGDEED